MKLPIITQSGALLLTEYVYVHNEEIRALHSDGLLVVIGEYHNIGRAQEVMEEVRKAMSNPVRHEERWTAYTSSVDHTDHTILWYAMPKE